MADSGENPRFLDLVGEKWCSWLNVPLASIWQWSLQREGSMVL